MLMLKRLVLKIKGWLTVPKDGSGQFLFFFLTEFSSYLLVCCGFRYLAQGRVLATGSMDFINLAMGAYIGKASIENDDCRTHYALWGYILGGTCGSMLSIIITNHGA
jgi:hypothetical protein